MKKGRQVKAALGIALCLLILAPFFLGAPAAHPATDDFTFATVTHRTWLETRSLPHVAKDALSYALRTWRDWQGTVTGVLVMALNPAVFDLEGYWAHAVLLLLLDIAAVLTAMRHFLGRAGLPGRMRLPAAAALLCVRLVFLPDIVEGIYWFNGAWFYTGANAAALLLLTAADGFAARPGRGGAALLALGFFALGLDNYITAMMALAALFALALLRLWAGRSGDEEGRRACLRTAAFLVPLGLGLLLSVLAPGNRVRMAADGAHESGAGWLLSSLLWTARDAGFYILRFSFKTPLLALLLGLTPRLCRALPSREESRGVPPAPAVWLGLFAILCCMIVPHMYSSGYAGSGRVVNMYHGFVVLALPLCWCLTVRRLPDGMRRRLVGKRGVRALAGASLAALALCLALGQQGNYIKLVRDQLDGTQRAYIGQFKSEYARCRAAGPEDDVLLPAWRVQTVTGKPTAYPDPTVWTNVSMADYFGVRSVRSEE